MSAEHTPGPWVCRETREDYRPEFDIWSLETEQHVAALYHSSSLSYVPGGIQREDVAAANGRLIAAAPDLLAACDVLVETMLHEEPCLDPVCEWCPAVRQAQAAIAKARGA